MEQNQITAIQAAIEGFIFDFYGDISASGDIVIFENKKIADTIKIMKAEKIIFLDYQFMITNITDFEFEGINARNLIDDLAYSKRSLELIKLLKIIFNSSNIKSTLGLNDDIEYEIRFFNFNNHITMEDVNSNFTGMLVTIKGLVFDRSDAIRNFPTQRIFQCNNCSAHVIQKTSRGSRLWDYKGICRNPIGSGNTMYRCKSKDFTYIRPHKVEDFFRVKIESLPDETPSKLDPKYFSVEFTHNLCCPPFLNEVVSGQAYEFLGFLISEEHKSPSGKVSFIHYLEVMSFRQIEKNTNKLNITNEERGHIKDFLSQPNAIDNLVSLFGKRVIGYQREKKFFIIMKALQESFNRNKATARPKDYLCHLLVVGDYSYGKSEFGELCEDICENSNYITGSSTSAVGLTGATVRDELTGHFAIQSGVLARSSQDVLIIEEFDKKQNKADFGILNEAMSKFSYTVAKGGKQRRFKSHTCIIIIANPINKKFDMETPINLQANITPDLLSRFTVISYIIKPDDIKQEFEINRIMLQATMENIVNEDKRNAEYIKKCLKVASEITPNMDDPMILEYVNNFTQHKFSIAQQVSGQDKTFYDDTSIPRARNSLIKLIRGVALLHLHKTPTYDDMREATDLLLSFQKEIIKFPKFLDSEAIALGRTKEEIIEEVVSQFKVQEMHISAFTSAKHSKFEKLIAFIRKENRDLDIMELKKEAINNLGYYEHDFDTLISKMLKEGEIIEVRRGFVRLL